jgi:hypothetical protein
VDYGNIGGNALGEPPDPSSAGQKPLVAMGGALRAQIVTPPQAPTPFTTSFSGKVIRIDPHGPDRLVSPYDVPEPPPVVAAGLRNPFRMAFRPGTKELWIGDVGWTSFEELNRLADASPGTKRPVSTSARPFTPGGVATRPRSCRMRTRRRWCPGTRAI